MTTALQIITRAAREAAILGDHETLSSGEAANGLVRLNDMLASWRVDRLLCYQLKEESFVLTVNDGIYTIGSGGDFDTDRPIEILKPCYVRENQTDYPCDVINRDAYGRIVSKSTVTSNYPRKLFYDTAYPLGIIKIYPVPSSANTLFINSLKEIQQFATLGTDAAIPTEYYDPIVYELAARHAAQKGYALNATTERVRETSLRRLKNSNAKRMVAHTEIPVGSHGRKYDIAADDY